MMDAQICRAVWRSVILQAIRDLLGLDAGYAGDLAQREARAWLGGRDFRLCCHYADWDPGYVMRKVHQLQAQPDRDLQASRERMRSWKRGAAQEARPCA
jgi:hypothetical protein